MQDFSWLHNEEGRFLSFFPLRAYKIVEFYGRLWTCCCGWNYKHIGSFVVIIIGNVMDFSMLAKICCCCCYLASVSCLLGAWLGCSGLGCHIWDFWALILAHPTPCHGWGHLPLSQVVPAWPWALPGMEQLCQALPTLKIKNFFVSALSLLLVIPTWYPRQFGGGWRWIMEYGIFLDLEMAFVLCF